MEVVLTIRYKWRMDLRVTAGANAKVRCFFKFKTHVREPPFLDGMGDMSSVADRFESLYWHNERIKNVTLPRQL